MGKDPPQGAESRKTPPGISLGKCPRTSPDFPRNFPAGQFPRISSRKFPPREVPKEIQGTLKEVQGYFKEIKELHKDFKELHKNSQGTSRKLQGNQGDWGNNIPIGNSVPNITPPVSRVPGSSPGIVYPEKPPQGNPPEQLPQNPRNQIVMHPYKFQDGGVIDYPTRLAEI